LLRVAGLVHDIGNPPFGHFGEEAIQDFFFDFFQENNFTCLNEQEKKDFICFDGNVQAFRILRKLYWFKNEYSFNLTFPLFATTIKYPSNSIDGNQKKKAREIRYKKFGYYISDEAEYQKINNALNLNNRRHPLVYLMEAADDIAYCAADIEDGVKLGAIGYDAILEVMEKNLTANRYLINDFETIYKGTDANIGNKLTIAIQQLRVKAQSKMIECVLKTFLDNYEVIMSGDFQEELISACDATDIRTTFRELGKIVYDDKKITQTELAGWEAIQGLLSIFIPAILSEDNGINRRLYRNISSSYRYIYEKHSKESHPNEQYNKIQLVVDFISGMTDSYAISLYQKLKGIRL
jgi:dGTPase